MSKIFQLKIKLLNTKPFIWRRVQVRANCTFWDLHVVIRDAMEWSDGQPHYFKLVDNQNKNSIIRSYLDDYNTNNFPLSWNIHIKKYLLNKRYIIYYVYGTNENHVHSIYLEKTLYKKLHVRYPICLSGYGIPDEEDSEEESLITKQVKSSYKFNVNDVVITEGNRALMEHKIILFDQNFS